MKSQFIVKCFHTRVGKWANGEKLALLEYVPGGDMFTLLKKLKRLTNAQTKFYSGQVILGQFKNRNFYFFIVLNENGNFYNNIDIYNNFKIAFKTNF